MAHRVTDLDYRALAEFRYRIRLFLETSEKAARTAGLEPEQYQLLLAVRGMPRGREATMQALAERLRVRHNTAVERVDRLALAGFLFRTRSRKDGRRVLVELRAKGRRMLEGLARKHLIELRRSGPELIRSLTKVAAATRRSAPKR